VHAEPPIEAAANPRAVVACDTPRIDECPQPGARLRREHRNVAIEIGVERRGRDQRALVGADREPEVCRRDGFRLAWERALKHREVAVDRRELRHPAGAPAISGAELADGGSYGLILDILAVAAPV